VEELGAARRLIGLLERENGLLKDRLETEKRTASLLVELNESRRVENEALRDAIAAKDEVIAAKEAVIESQGKLIEGLKNKKTSPWKRLGDVLVGVAAGMVLK
jgi:regulator of replication initiation timing